MSSPFIPFNRPTFFQNDFNDAIQLAVAHGQFSGDGIITKKCEEFFRSQYGYMNSLLTPSCTAALEMAALLLDVGPTDEVIVPSFTFVSSANAFALRGAKIVFADSEKDSPNVSVDDILKKVTTKTKAILVVHYAGIPVDVSKILNETNNRIPVVEDCAHAITSVDPRSGDFLGKAGCMSTFSFHETKNVGIGEGGLLVVNDNNLWKRAQIIREKGTNRVDFKAGRESFYTWVDLGSSYLMSEVDAAALLGALKNIDRIQQKRLQIWDTYDKKIVSSPNVYKKPRKEQMRANAHIYFLDFSSSLIRSEFCNAMKEANILVTTHYLPLDSSPFILKMRANKGVPSNNESCYQAAVWSNTLVRLPLFEDLTQEELNRVITTVNEFSPSIYLDLANECYWEDIRKIRNDNRECFTHADDIGREEHWKFMKEHSSTYRVAVHNKKCVGFIGHVNNDVRLATNLKGCGIGKFMWEAFGKEFGNLDVKVLENNFRSLAFFCKLGYTPDPKSVENKENPVVLTRVCI